MTVFTGRPYSLDILYLQCAGASEIVSIPLCEVMNGLKNCKYDRERSIGTTEKKGSYVVCFTADTEKEKNKAFEMPVAELARNLEAEVYNKQVKITKLIIQPAEEYMTPEVTEFLAL